jgi:hypothetical protein
MINGLAYFVGLTEKKGLKLLQVVLIFFLTECQISSSDESEVLERKNQIRPS